MAQWECIVCGLIYDEAEGWPDDGIAPGTKWADVPEDWLCPDCGVGKEDFELIAGSEDESTAASDEKQAPIVIIGTGLSGYTLCREFRKLDKESKIIMVTRDDGSNYSKPMLSTGFTKSKKAKDLAMKDAAGMAEQMKLDIMTFTQVNKINTEAQSLDLILQDGSSQSLEYGKLVIAWGADTITPPIKGDGAYKVFSINDLIDYGKFRYDIEAIGAKKIVIIGGGLIGCEFTNDLLNGGFTIDTIDPMGYCLPTLLPEAAGKAVQNALEADGANFHFGPLVTEVNLGEGNLEVSLNNGEVLEADVVLSAVGVRARIEPAKSSGIECNRGVVANRYLETSADNVYTLGDCAEVEGHVLFYVAPLMAGARALAKTLNGERTAVEYPAMPVSIKTPSCPVVVAPPARDAQGEWTIEQDGNNVKGEFRDASGQLLGFALTGDFVSEKAAMQKELPALF